MRYSDNVVEIDFGAFARATPLRAEPEREPLEPHLTVSPFLTPDDLFRPLAPNLAKRPSFVSAESVPADVWLGIINGFLFGTILWCFVIALFLAGKGHL